MSPGIQAEIKQNQPFSSREEEACLALLRTADQLQWRLSEMLKPHRLSPTQYNALRILQGAGSKGLPCGEIGERMVSRDPDITRLLDRLQRRRLIRRTRGRKDRRVIEARITSAGLRLLRHLEAEVEEMPRRLLGHLSSQQLESLIRLLEVVRGTAG
ncbi:MAG: MarR family transcriptional regulator [Terriglobales bacterium]